MWLTELEADRLRNLRAVSLRLSAGLTLVAGRNGQGKSSLLEAVYLLATGRSFRTRRLDEVVSWEVVSRQYNEAYRLAAEATASNQPVVLDSEF